jgi:DNA-binding response OmpR family regulator
MDREILVVEDDPDLNTLVGAYVRLAGFRYLRALDGQAGLREAQERHPSLIVLDVMLPDADGFEVCRELKADIRTTTIPILMLTALDHDEYRRRGLACGADEYMTKPFDPERLLTALRSRAGRNGN